MLLRVTDEISREVSIWIIPCDRNPRLRDCAERAALRCRPPVAKKATPAKKAPEQVVRVRFKPFLKSSNHNNILNSYPTKS